VGISCESGFIYEDMRKMRNYLEIIYEYIEKACLGTGNLEECYG